MLRTGTYAVTTVILNGHCLVLTEPLPQFPLLERKDFEHFRNKCSDMTSESKLALYVQSCQSGNLPEEAGTKASLPLPKKLPLSARAFNSPFEKFTIKCDNITRL
jgi:hypothetical protein